MNWIFVESCTKTVLRALPVTLELTVISFVLSLLLAVIIAIVDYFKIPVLRQIFAVYVSFFRGTPLIPQLFLLYFGIPTFIQAVTKYTSNNDMRDRINFKFSRIYGKKWFEDHFFLYLMGKKKRHLHMV